MQTISKINGWLRTYTLHFLLLPVVFILITYNRYAGLLNRTETINALLLILAGVIVFTTLVFLLNRNLAKAGIITTITGVYFLFFYDIKLLLAKLPLLSVFSRYSLFLPASIIIYIIFLVILKKAPSLHKTTSYLNLLFIILLFIELGKLMNNTINDRKYTPGEFATHIADTLNKPDIFYILADTYPNFSYQHTRLNINDNPLDSFLVSQKFFITENPKSNYNKTIFSLASILNMRYLNFVSDNEIALPYHYNEAMLEIKNSKIPRFMQACNYQFKNWSIFDIDKKPALMKLNFITAGTTYIIFFNTLWARAKWDLGLYFFKSLRDKTANRIQEQREIVLSKFKWYNQLVCDSLLKTSPRDNRPLFVYAHLLLPHFPFFYDSAGHETNYTGLYNTESFTDPEKFSNYIRYADKKLIELTRVLLKRKNTVIIIQSDHGVNEFKGSEKNDAFRNFTAIYFPDNNYNALYHGMSNINTFRIVLNKYFGQQLPLLADSSVYLK